MYKGKDNPLFKFTRTHTHNFSISGIYIPMLALLIYPFPLFFLLPFRSLLHPTSSSSEGPVLAIWCDYLHTFLCLYDTSPVSFPPIEVFLCVCVQVFSWSKWDSVYKPTSYSSLKILLSLLISLWSFNCWVIFHDVDILPVIWRKLPSSCKHCTLCLCFSFMR